ncbi:MAG: hypothetical protein ACLU1W_07685 [Collinsella sp.]
MPAGAVHADEIERTYGPLTCKALPALMEWLALRSDLIPWPARRMPSQ